ncbi:hypothetical protein [Ohtaekwangia koreensis]|uniref:Uncharacterized protein n=1 Tax=Ohtaekwangia koreensis TaxID=688867 RepID=A0A1T5KN57_9BACT|nr:hypothetical protein [Ohtaekwangia koreensis]SKC65061.1 hypothetical protein SAMN05660236_2386 [Ohtaekwangia koreensis]
MRLLYLYIIFLFANGCTPSLRSPQRSFDSFILWRTGHDAETIQQIPLNSNDASVRSKNESFVHVKFNIKGYGEVSVPINTKTVEGSEALQADISQCKSILLTYKANHEFIVQLRQTGIHGGIHNQITLPGSEIFTMVTIPFTEFKGGVKPLDLKDVSKFNFAFLSNDPEDGFAELKISGFSIQ